MSTKIEWVKNPDGTQGETWNPVSGCTKVSAGCAHCYAERNWPRLAAPGQPYEGRAFTDVQIHPERLVQPLRWSKPRMVFVNSMSDLFHPDVPLLFITAVIGVMAAARYHTFQILTKRPDRMLNLFKILNGHSDPLSRCYASANDYGFSFPAADSEWPLRNIWLGVSIEDQATADERIPLLLKTPAARRFVSAEPLLGKVNLEPYLLHAFNREPHCKWCEDCIPNSGSSDYWKSKTKDNHGPFIDWLIAGGESGHKARSMHPDWIRSLRDQCIGSGVPFFFKQWGEWREFQDATADTDLSPELIARGKMHTLTDGTEMIKIGKRAAGCKLDGRFWSEMPV